MAELRQAWPLPSAPRPIVIIGCGGIVRDAHLPAYQRIGLPIAGLFDRDTARAHEMAERFGIQRVFASMEEARALDEVVFDVAVPGDQVLPVLRELPVGSGVLIQKPMGRDLAEACEILRLCRAQSLVAALNFQLRFSPNMLALSDAIERGDLGQVRDVEVRVQTHTPWELWPFLRGIPRLEILYHSIHYLDLVRSFLGDPRSVQAWVGGEPAGSKEYADTRSTAVLDYGNDLRCLIHTNHRHLYGREREASEIKVEGTRGAAVARMGVNLEYPRGLPDKLEIATEGGPWKAVPLRGSWFTEAFEGPMCSLQRFLLGQDPEMPTCVEHAARTMALVEACYDAARRGGVPIPTWKDES